MSARFERRADELRAAFDRGFAAPHHLEAAAHEDLLAIRVGGAPFALRLREVASLAVDRPVTPLPTAAASLLGLAGFRGALVPVHDLRVLLGAVAAAPPRWVVLVAGGALGLAFELFERHLRVTREEIAGDGGGRALVPGPIARPILDLASLRAAVERQARSITTQEGPSP